MALTVLRFTAGRGWHRAIAMGMGLNGLRPVARFSLPTTSSPPTTKSSTRSQNATPFRWRILDAGHLRTPAGGGIKGGHHHSQSLNRIHPHPGLKVVYCSNPRNAKGLLTSAIESNDPVIFFEPKRCYRGRSTATAQRADVEQPSRRRSPGGLLRHSPRRSQHRPRRFSLHRDRLGAMVHVCEQAIKDSGVDCELIDLQTLVPWDRDTVVNSVKKTDGRHRPRGPKDQRVRGRDERSIQERCFYHLEAPIQRVPVGTRPSRTPPNGITCPVHLASQKPYKEHRRNEHGKI